MSSNVWPNLPVMQVDSQRTPFFNVAVSTAMSGKEQRTVWQGSPRYRYALRYDVRDNVMAPAPWAAFSEKAIVNKFYEDHYGEWDSFLFYDPFDGVQRRVRFAESPRFTRKVPGPGTSDFGWWTADVSLVSVL